MAFFGFGADKQDRPEWVMAYLEEAMILQLPFQLTNPEGVRVQGRLTEFDEAAGTGLWNLEGPLFAHKGERIAMTVVFGELRIGAQLLVRESHPRTVSLELPSSLVLAEQRKALRFRLSSQERASFTAMTGLYEGVAFLGGVENLSTTGARLRISRALAIKTQAPLRLGAALLPTGQAFVVLKIKNLPKFPHTLDLSGQVVYAESTFRDLCAGVQFQGISAEAAAHLEAFLAPRVGGLPDTIPPKERRRKVEAKPGPREIKEPLKPEVSPPVCQERAPEPAAPGLDPPPVNAMTRLKKRGRILAVLAPEGAGEPLRDFLQAEGYGRVVGVRKPSELVDLAHHQALHLVFVECTTPLIQNLELLAGLKRELPEGIPMIVAVNDVAAAQSPKVQHLGIARFLPRPYSLDAAFSSLLEQILGLR